MRGPAAIARIAAGAGLLLLLGTCAPAPAPQDTAAEEPVTAPAAALDAPAPSPTPSTSPPPPPSPEAAPAAADPPPAPPAPSAPPAPPPAPPPATAEPPPPAQPPPPPPPPRPRSVTETGWAPFATAGPVVLAHPSNRVERVGFHQSTHEGARDLQIQPSAASPVVLDSRERRTGRQTAADVVADPAVEIRAPVSGTVVRAGTYVLYCDYRDDFAVIEPDARPGWEVKILHINGVLVRPGDRVEAGVTVLAGGPTPLPFESQVDEHTAEPSWPHVHIEVVDPSVPNIPEPGGGC